MRIAIAGYGVVGRAHAALFQNFHEVVVIDPKHYDRTFDDTIDAVIVCVLCCPSICRENFSPPSRSWEPHGDLDL